MAGGRGFRPVGHSRNVRIGAGTRSLAGAQALAALLQLDLDDWPFGRLLATLGGTTFSPWPEWQDGRAAADVERTIRSLQIPRDASV